MQERGVPYALTSQNTLADPAVVSREESCTCLNCGEPVLLKRGERNRAHFAHLAYSQCSRETVEHLAAKKRLQEYFSQHLNTPLKVNWSMRCQGYLFQETLHAEAKTKRCPEQQVLWEEVQLPLFDQVVLEHNAGYIADVALLLYGEVVFWLEVYHTHRVPEDKAGRLSFPWAEMHALDVLQDPTHLPLLRFHQPPRQCQRCLEREQQNQQHIERQLEEQRQRKAEQERLALKRKQEHEAWQAGEPLRRAARWKSLQERYGRIFPFVRRYFRDHRIQAGDHPLQLFFATRCVRCKKPVVFFDTRGPIEGAFRMKHLLDIQKRTGRRGGAWYQFTNKCVYCEEKHHIYWIDKVRHDPAKGVQFAGMDFITWLKGDPEQSP